MGPSLKPKYKENSMWVRFLILNIENGFLAHQHLFPLHLLIELLTWKANPLICRVVTRTPASI